MHAFPLSNRARWSALLLTALLAACGGGSDSGSASNSNDGDTGGTTPTPTPEPASYTLTLNVRGLPEGGQLALRHGESEYPITANGSNQTLTVADGDSLALGTPAFGTNPTNLFDCVLTETTDGILTDGVLQIADDAAQAIECAAAQVVPARKYTTAYDATNIPNGIGLLRINPLTGSATWLKDANGQELSASHSILSFNLAAQALTPASALFNGRLYFVAFSNEFGTEVWSTDGTDAGTRMLKDIRTGGATNAAKAGADSNVQFASIGDGKLYFLGQPAGVNHVYETDGTEAGTQRVEPDSSKLGGSTTYTLKAVDDKLFVFGTISNRSSLMQLSSTAGERSFTALVDGATGIVNTTLLASAGQADKPLVFFTRKVTEQANTENSAYWLWSSDGTPEGTQQVSSRVEYFHQYLGGGAVDANGTLHFVGKTAATGYELWHSDGTDSGTALTHDIGLDGAPSVATQAPKNITPVGEQVYFTAYDTEHGRELWRTDGSSNGTALVQDIFPGPDTGTASAGVPANFNVASGKLIFSASATGTAPQDLWTADGATAARLLPDDDARKDSAKSNTVFTPLSDGRLLFVHEAVDGDSTTLNYWLSDGTQTGTTPLLDSSTGQALSTVIK